MLYLLCTSLFPVDHARYEAPYAQELSTYTRGSCYNSTLYVTRINGTCGTGQNIIKIKASYQRRVMSKS